MRDGRLPSFSRETGEGGPRVSEGRMRAERLRNRRALIRHAAHGAFSRAREKGSARP